MTSLDQELSALKEEISALKNKIEKNEVLLEQATDKEEKLLYGGLLKSYNERITELQKEKVLLQQQATGLGGGSTKNEEIFSGIASCANYICFKDYRGNAVAISPSQALTALHGAVSNGEQVSLRDHRGKQRNASVIFSAFEELRFDIAVVELHKGEDPFEHFIPICDEPVKCGQTIYVVGLTPSLHDKDTLLQFVDAKVIGIEPSSSLFRSSFDGLSGAGVIVSLEYGQYHCVGVHVGTHDDTSSPPPIKRKKGGVADFDSVSDSSNSLASSIHGHTAYSLICEARRVPKISDVININ